MLAAALATATAHKTLVANWAPEVAIAATVNAPIAGMPEEDFGLLVMATIDRETGGKNILGDGGHGHGLMQLDDRFNAAFLAAHQNGLDPASNIMEGSRQLACHIAAMRKVVPTLGPVPEDLILLAACASYNAGEGREARLLRDTADAPQIDAPTTGHDYGQDVLRRRDEFKAVLSAAATPVA
jgi:hypothetical protein